MLSYFEALAAESPRLHVEQIGKSAEGRPLVALFVSSEANIGKLDELQQVHSRLADPRVLTQEERQELEATARSVILVTLGIHPAEIASSQTAPVLVHDLLAREDGQAATIRDNTVVIVVPSVNPDGFDLVYDWYQKTFGTTAEGTWPPSITQKYAGGENNRDWFLLTQPEQRAVVERIFRRWHPHVGLDHHQMEEYGFRYFIPPYADPINPNIDPAIQAATSSIGMRIASDLTSAGLGGVVTGLFFSQYSPATTYSPYHGGVHILTEGASCRLATPIDIAPGQIAPFHGADPNLSRVCQPLPWTGGRWGMREIIAYNMAATLSAIEEVALNRPNWVRRQVDVRQRACTANGKSAFVIPAEQSDRKLAEELVEALLRGGVEVHRAGETFSAGGRQYDAGAFIVRLDQSASAYAKALLEYQLLSAGAEQRRRRRCSGPMT